MNEHLINGFHQRGYLPHVKIEGVSYFVTFRLADSLPKQVLDQLEAELERISFPSTLAADQVDAERQRERRRRIEEALDNGAGSCCLRRPEIAELVDGALRHFDGSRYNLEAWVVMPNHVHVLLKPATGNAVGDIVKSWKQFTATRVKRSLELPEGRFWQPEYYDHWVRDEEDRARIVRYIENNPVKSGLCVQPQDWPWSSAAGKKVAQASSLPAVSDAGWKPALLLISAPVAAPNAELALVELRVERRTLMKRLWRGTAVDGVEFGFELSAPLKHGDTFYQTEVARYVIAQEPEAVLEIPIGDLPPSATAGVGWAVGNLHLEFSSEATRLLTPDEPAARQLLARIQIEYRPTTAIFRAGRFKRSVDKPIVDELGPSHKH